MATEHQSIGIVGGGRGGYDLLQMLALSKTAQVRFVVDLNEGAPAMELARSMGVNALTDLESALRDYAVDYVIEATGAAAVLQKIQQHLPAGSELISSKTALFLFRIIEETQSQTNDQVYTDVRNIQTTIADSVTDSQRALEGIKKVAKDLTLLSLNAGIEAGRAGTHGRGFAIVAEKVQETAKTARKLAEDVEKVNTEILAMAENIDASLKRLHH